MVEPFSIAFDVILLPKIDEPLELYKKKSIEREIILPLPLRYENKETKQKKVRIEWHWSLRLIAWLRAPALSISHFAYEFLSHIFFKIWSTNMDA